MLHSCTNPYGNSGRQMVNCRQWTFTLSICLRTHRLHVDRFTAVAAAAASRDDDNYIYMHSYLLFYNRLSVLRVFAHILAAAFDCILSFTCSSNVSAVYVSRKVKRDEGMIEIRPKASPRRKQRLFIETKRHLPNISPFCANSDTM